MNVQEEYASLVHRPWGSQNGGHPFIHVISLGTSTANIEGKKINNSNDIVLITSKIEESLIKESSILCKTL